MSKIKRINKEYMIKILPELPLTENQIVDYISHNSQTSNISTINNLYSMQTLSMPKATRSNKLMANAKPILVTILMIIIFVNVSKAQTATNNPSSLQASAAVPSDGKNLAVAYQKNSNGTWGYKVVEDNQTVYVLKNKPGSNDGYPTIAEAIIAGQKLVKAMQEQTKAIKSLTKNEMQDLLNKTK
jgi:hypothetical protein